MTLAFADVISACRGYGWPAVPRTVKWPNANVEGCTPREQEVLSCVLSGKTNSAIAIELSISERTVEHHIASVLNRLGLNSRIELFATLVKGTGSPLAAARAPDELRPEVPSLLSRLATVGKRFTLEDAVALSGGEADEFDVLDMLGTLVKRGLICVEFAEGSQHYLIAATVRPESTRGTPAFERDS